jgi:hypothetical protein
MSPLEGLFAFPAGERLVSKVRFQVGVQVILALERTLAVLPFAAKFVVGVQGGSADMV